MTTSRILNLILLLFITEALHAQSLDELYSRRAKEREQINLSYNKGNVYKETCWEKFVDFIDDLDDTWGIGYTFSPHFPVAVSANYTTSCFSITGELGAPCTSKKYDMKDNNKDLPLFYAMISPGFYCKYVGIHYGVGYMFNLRDYPSLTVNGVPEQYDKTLSGAFCHKPSITGYIPICDEDYYITLNAGYAFVPKFKELNGFTCGIGFQWEL